MTNTSTLSFHDDDDADDLLVDDRSTPQSVEVSPASGKQGAIRRWVNTADHLFTTALIEEKDINPQGGYRTLWECFQRPVNKYPNNNALGTRQYLLADDGKSYQLGPDKQPSVCSGTMSVTVTMTMTIISYRIL
jgi:hypothetical protein